MAEVRPFRALRFTPAAGNIEELTCPPYDIISEEQRREYLERNPYNVIRLELPREGEDPYAKAGETLKSWLEGGILKKDEKPAFYVYEIEFSLEKDNLRRRVMGLVGQVKLEEFEKGIVLPHEETLSKAKTDRFNLMKATNCNFSSIYSLYMDEPGNCLDIASLIAGVQPVASMTDHQGLTHRLWAITDEEKISLISSHMRDKKLYIADGHHRYETALNYRNYLREKGVQEGAPSDYVMMVMVEMNHPGLVVFPTHRMVRGIGDFEPNRIISECEKYFDITRNIDISLMDEALSKAYDSNLHAFGFYTGGSSFTLLTLKDSSVMDSLLPKLSPASRTLDVTILHTLVLERLMGIDRENMANQRSLAYTRDIGEVLERVNNGEFQCGFVLNPTRVTEIRDVALAGEKMPQKSTYFYPKLITGLTMNKLD
ncbi:MAG TPA: DUF1015 domain-containing protein [Clostridiales bacterium]|nr:DUF1015 domain-containing protein [Clostridiales bacterium]